MSLFKESGNHDIEGVTSINACYGASNALFNSLNWLHSPSWDGRYAIVVSSDLAIYPKGGARPTGGVGSIAMLLGPDAPVVFNPVRGTFMDHAYDFYKPDISVEYPTVDGQQSISLYLNALTQAFKTFKSKFQSYHGRQINLDDFDFMCFHTPFSKMVQKSFFALLLEDMKERAESGRYDKNLLAAAKETDFKFDAKINKVLVKSEHAKEWKHKTERTLLLAK